MAAQDKTEKATPKRRSEARNNGQVVRSIEVNTAMALLVAWLAFRAFGQGTIGTMADMFTQTFQHMHEADVSQTALKHIAVEDIMLMARMLVPIAGLLLLGGLLANVLQVGFHIAPKAARPQLSRVNPLSGFQRLVSVRSLAELLKGLLKLAIVGFVAYKAVTDHLEQLILLTGADVRGAMVVVGDIGMELLFKVGIAYLVLATADYGFQKWQFEKSIRMTKQEVKEEARSQDLAPELRSRIRNVQRQIARRRMMQRVPQADVVITNPTHLAIAIQYDASKMAAPRVIAKGQRLIAEQIKDIARKHGIPLVENKPLAQAIYKAVEVDQEIPRELYKAMAEVLAFIYRLKQQRMAS